MIRLSDATAGVFALGAAIAGGLPGGFGGLMGRDAASAGPRGIRVPTSVVSVVDHSRGLVRER